MTEKRFNLAFYDKYDGTFSIQDALYQQENKHLHSLDEIVDLLNQLNDENIEMHIQNDFLKDENQHMRDLVNENEQLKEVLGSILLEVRKDISNTNQTGEIKVFINTNSFDLISEVLRKYGSLKEWYE